MKKLRLIQEQVNTFLEHNLNKLGLQDNGFFSIVFFYAQISEKKGICMEFKNFVEEVKETIKQYFREEVTIEIKEILKNNGVLMTGLVILEKDRNCAPNIYLNDFYEQYQNGKTIYHICSDIMMCYKEFKMDKRIDMDFFSNYGVVKEKLTFRLVNYVGNQELLNQVPHVPFLDLAIIFACNVSNECVESGSILIRNEHMKEWNITVDELQQDALKNAIKTQKAEIRPMEDVIYDMVKYHMNLEIQNLASKNLNTKVTIQDDLINPIVDEMLEKMYSEAKGPQMYVLTNDSKYYGAGTILYDNLMMDFAIKTQMDYYVIPSSVHEMILVPMTECEEDLSYLKNMVCEVNKTELAKEEILSDCIYVFRKDEGNLKIML